MVFGTLLASHYRVDTYHYDLFRQLNRAGRLIITLDGLHEMKHGMIYATFKREVTRLFDLSLHEGHAWLIILARPNAFSKRSGVPVNNKGKGA